MTPSFRALFRFPPSLGFLAAALLLSCHLTRESTTEEVFTFPTLADTLQGSDSVRIILTDTGGIVIDTLYRGPVLGSDFIDLAAPHYRGGKAVVSIEAVKNGVVVYRVDKVYNGTSGVVDSTIVFVPRTPWKPGVESVAFDRGVLEVFAEGAAETLLVAVLPNGADARIRFTLADSTRAAIRDGRVLGLEAGETWLIATSVEDTGKSDTLRLVILPKPPLPVDSVTISEDTLRLFTGGEGGRLTAAIHPSFLAARFAWSSSASSIASVDSLGNVLPLAPGRAYVRARSIADTAKGDNCLILVRRDVPRLDPGVDTTVSVGANVVFRPRVAQDYGSILKVRWDLDGDGSWDDSGEVFKDTSRQFAAPGIFTARFQALDGEGNDTLSTRKITVVNGPAVHFQNTKDLAFTNQNPLPVSWTVDGAQKTSLDSLKPGPNILTRTAWNNAGDSVSVSITVFYDTVPPGKPVVRGPATSATRRPTWTWETGGGGDGTFRYRLDNGNMATGTTMVRDSVFAPGRDLADSQHTLFVQERDAAGNWSAAGSFTILLDATPPGAPVIDSIPLSPVASLRPLLKWSSGGNGGSGMFRFKLDNGAFSAYASATTYQVPLQKEGIHIFHVQERDSLGNESTVSSRRIVLLEKGFLGTRGAINASSVRASAFNSKGIPHLAVQESSYGNVLAYENSWRPLGNAFSDSVREIHSLAFNQDTAFVCFTESGGYRSVAVRKCINGIWRPVGENPIDSLATTNHASMAISQDGIPYVCWITAAETDIRVVRLNPSTNRWEPVGSGPVYHTADYWNRVSIAFDARGDVHVAFNDVSANFFPTVKKLAGNSWAQVAQYPASSGHHLKLIFHGSSAYLASEQQGGSNFKTNILRFDPSWEISSEHSVVGINPDMAITSDGKPFVITSSGDASGNLCIHSIIAGELRTAVLPAPTASPGVLAVSPLGIPLISFSDTEVGGYISMFKFGFEQE